MSSEIRPIARWARRRRPSKPGGAGIAGAPAAGIAGAAGRRRRAPLRHAQRAPQRAAGVRAAGSKPKETARYPNREEDQDDSLRHSYYSPARAPKAHGLRSLLGRLNRTPSPTHKMALPASTLASIARSIGRGDAGAAVVVTPRPARPPLTSCCSSTRPCPTAAACARRQRGRPRRSGRARARPCFRGTIDPARHRFRAAARDALDAHAGRDAPLRFPLLADCPARRSSVRLRAIVDHLCSVHGGGATGRARPRPSPRRGRSRHAIICGSRRSGRRRSNLVNLLADGDLRACRRVGREAATRVRADVTPGRAASAADAAPRPQRLWASENDPLP